MKSPLFCSDLEVKKSSVHGYGVFAKKDIEENNIIEECHVLFIPKKPNYLIDYAFRNKNIYVLPLGYGAIYNHADKPNAKYVLDQEKSILIISAKQPIKKNEEIYISYGKAWFESRTLLKKKSPSWRYKFAHLVPYSLRSLLVRFLLVSAVLLLFPGLILFQK